MEKDEILAKSRAENKSWDLYTQEIQTAATSVSSFVALFLATVFVIVQTIMGNGINVGLYAICTSAGATQFIVKAVYLKRKHDIVLTLIYAAVTLTLTGVYLYQLAAAI